MSELIIELNQQMKSILDDYLQQSLADLPDESELSARQTFSRRFTRRMHRLVRKARRIEASWPAHDQAAEIPNPSRSLTRRRKRLLLAAIILATVLSIFSISAAREAVFGFFVQVYEKFSTIIFDSGSGDPTEPISPSETGDGLKEPSELPAGFVETFRQETDKYCEVIYTHSDGGELSFIRQKSNNMQMIIDSENIQTEDILVGQAKGLYFSNKGVQSIVWQDDLYVYLLSGNFTKEELINIAIFTN